MLVIEQADRDKIPPLFSLFTLEEISRRTGYTERYLVDVKFGDTSITGRFRKVCSRILQRPEAELFGNSDGAE